MLHTPVHHTTQTAAPLPPPAPASTSCTKRGTRKGLRTSEDLELAAGKRAVPLLLAMADSPVGNGDAVIQDLIVDILGRVASLERSGARYGVLRRSPLRWIVEGYDAVLPTYTHNGGPVRGL